MPDCTDWTPVPIYMTLATMVAKISGRVFVGPELCRNKDYVDCAVNYTMDVMGVVREVKALNPWLKPIFAPRLAVRKRLQKREQQMAHDILYPVVRAREEAEAKDPNWEKPDDMLSWAMNRRKDYGGRSTEYMAKLQLGLIFAAVHTTTSSATNMCVTRSALSPTHWLTMMQTIRPRGPTRRIYPAAPG
jgi:cytochrome P450